jgi:hypothetical protein
MMKKKAISTLTLSAFLLLGAGNAFAETGNAEDSTKNPIAQQVRSGYSLIGEAVNPTPEINNTIGDFYQKSSSFLYRGGKVILSSNAEGTGFLAMDDRVTINVTHRDGTVTTYSFTYGYPDYIGYVTETAPVDITHLFERGINEVEVIYTNTMQGGAGGTSHYLTELR